MSGGNTIATVTVLLETGIVPMAEPVTELTLDTAAGLVGVSARCQGGRVEAVTFRNVPCFAWALDVPIDVPGLGEIKVDIAWGGMFYALVDLRQDAPAMRDLGLEVRPDHGRRLVEVGERIKRAVQAQTDPVHPENPEIRGVTIVELTEPAVAVSPGVLQASNAVVISPGRLDRCPCGTGTSARMAVMAARGQLRRGDELRHRSPIGTEFVGRVEEDRETTARCGHLDAIVPSITGSAWITGYHTYKLHPADPFPEGFRVGDIWHM